ncbi:cysteine-rich receptor-like protein kinase 8 [Tanacetum coccineum]
MRGKKQREGLAVKPISSTILNSYTNNQRPSNTSAQRYNTPKQQNSSNNVIERRSNFKKGFYCRNYGKEGHFQEECYKIVGYPVGHPLHGKYQPLKPVNKSTRAVNMLVGQEDTKTQASSSHSQATSQATNSHMSARMDQLQNQLNQVLLMLQNIRTISLKVYFHPAVLRFLDSLLL